MAAGCSHHISNCYLQLALVLLRSQSSCKFLRQNHIGYGRTMAAIIASSLNLTAACRSQSGLQAKPSASVTHARCTPGKLRLQVSCRYGGSPAGGRGGGGMRMPGSGIIIPGTGRQGGNDGMPNLDGLDTPVGSSQFWRVSLLSRACRCWKEA